MEPKVAATPPPLSTAFVPSTLVTRLSTDAIADLSYTVPRIIATYIRPSVTRPAPAHDIFFFTSALHLRNLTPSACLVGNTVLPVDSYMNEITLCVIDDVPADGVSITLELESDEALHSSLTEELQLDANITAERLRPGVHLKRLPSRRDRAPSDDYSVRLTGRYALPSNGTVSHALVDDFAGVAPAEAEKLPRYPICHATMIRNGGHMLADWVDYHRRIGVDHTFIFDNGATPSPSTLFANRSDVEVLSWPWAKTQMQAFGYILVVARRRCRYVFLSDVDEFVMLGLGARPFSNGRRPFHVILENAKNAGFSHLQFRNFYMVNSGYVRTPVGHVPELYTHARKRQSLGFAKSVCSADTDWRAGRIHCCGLDRHFKKPVRLMETQERIRANEFEPREPADAGFIVHFFERSWEEFVEKWNIGTAAVLNRLKRDRRIGIYRLDQPKRNHIDVDRDNVVRYTFFRDVWQRVSTEAADRLHESVLVWQLDGESNRIVVLVNER